MSAADLVRVDGPIAGYVPLKGNATLPTGTSVDARKGRLAVTSAVDGRRVGSGGTTQTATLAAGLDGIENRIEPPDAFEGDVYTARDLPQVPHSLNESIAALDASK